MKEMGINLVYERANKDAYDLLVAANEMAKVQNYRT